MDRNLSEKLMSGLKEVASRDPIVSTVMEIVGGMTMDYVLGGPEYMEEQRKEACQSILGIGDELTRMNGQLGIVSKPLYAIVQHTEGLCRAIERIFDRAEAMEIHRSVVFHRIGHTSGDIILTFLIGGNTKDILTQYGKPYDWLTIELETGLRPIWDAAHGTPGNAVEDQVPPEVGDELSADDLRRLLGL